jgi:YD repeat-containing protein
MSLLPSISIADLHQAMADAGFPVVGVLLVSESPPTVTVQYDAAATPTQIINGNAFATAFDWTPAGHAARETTRARTAAGVLLAASQNNQAMLFRAVAAVLLDELNILRAAMPRGIVSITRATNTATATCSDPHGLTTGDTVRIRGATLAAYNVAAVATVVNATTFTYPVAGSPVTPAVGSISFTLGVVPTMGPRTLAQARTAILAKIAAGLVDS